MRLFSKRRLRLSGRAAAALVMAAVTLVLAMATLPTLLGYRTLSVHTGSMAPYAPTGSLVLTRPVDVADVAVGDVVLLRRSGDDPTAPVLHRVIDVDRAGGDIVVRTKGDANSAADPEPWTLRGATLTPVLVLPELGFLVALAATPLGWILLVVLPAACLCAATIARIWRAGNPANPVSALA